MAFAELSQADTKGAIGMMSPTAPVFRFSAMRKRDRGDNILVLSMRWQ